MSLAHKTESKLLKPADIPENFTRSLYKIAPYRGCAHGCRYCDGRSERYYVEGDYERDIEIRSTIPERLARELPLVRERGMVAFGSGVTDAYQPLEARETITGACARLLADARAPLPALVMTKSRLVLRDLPLWQRVNERAGFVLLISLTSLNEELRERMEPGASSFASRLEVIRSFKSAGCAVGVLAMPFLPGLSDDIESIRSLYAACAEAKPDFIMPGGLTLRPGRQKEFYLQALRDYRPDLIADTQSRFIENRLSGAPTRAAARSLFERISVVQREFHIPALLPHKIFAGFLPAYDSLSLLFKDMVELYRTRGVDTAALSKSASDFDTWLIVLKRGFRRKRSLPDSWLEERFQDAVDTGELARTLANDRLARFSEAVLKNGARLNYTTLRLESS